MTEPVIRRRTLEERIAYLQGHIAGLRMAFGMTGPAAKRKAALRAHIELEQNQLSAAIAERAR